MSMLPSLRLTFSLIVAAFGLATFLVMRGNNDAFGLALWGMSPQLVALLVLVTAKDRRKRWVASVAIALFCLAGVTIFFQGGSKALFLPIYELTFLAMTFLILTLVGRRRA